MSSKQAVLVVEAGAVVKSVVVLVVVAVLVVEGAVVFADAVLVAPVGLRDRVLYVCCHRVCFRGEGDRVVKRTTHTWLTSG